MVLSSTLTDIGFVDAAVVALLGYAVVFFGLVLLMIVVIGMGKIFIAIPFLPFLACGCSVATLVELFL